MIACFLSNISAKYYKNPSMLSRVIAKNVGDVFFETQCTVRMINFASTYTSINAVILPQMACLFISMTIWYSKVYNKFSQNLYDKIELITFME